MTDIGFCSISRTATVAVLLSVFLCAGQVQAASVVILSSYINGSTGDTVTTESYLNSPTGSGVQTAQVTELFLQFSHRGYQQAAVIDLVVPPGPPWPEKTIIATFEDGVFLDFHSVDAGGNASVAVTPPSNWLGENIRLDPTTLIDLPCCSGFTRYSLVSHVVVPLPASAWLLFSGIIAIRRSRRSR